MCSELFERRLTKARIYWKYRFAFRLVSQVLSYVRGRLDTLILSEKQRGFPEICLFFGTKAYRHLLAVDQLCSMGYAADAKGLVRSLLHMWIDIQWIALDREERSNRWIGFYPIARWELAGLDWPEEKRERFRKEYEAALPNYSWWKRDGYSKRWSGLTLPDRAMEVDSKKRDAQKTAYRNYKVVYKSTSGHEHTDPFSIQAYFEEEDVRLRRAAIRPTAARIDYVLPAAFMYSVGILEYLDEVCQLGMEDTLGRFKNQMNDWLKNSSAGS